MQMPDRVKNAIRQQAQTQDSFYLYDESCILAQLQKLQVHFPQVELLYSVKCNPHPQILRSIFKQGFGADAASLGEVLQAADAGLPPEKIYYSAPGKTHQDLAGALDRAVLIADSLSEIERVEAIAGAAGRVVEMGLRINPGFTFDGAGGQPSKFGVDEEQALAFLAANPCPHVKITGIHVHLRSQELRAETLARYYQNMFALAARFQQACGPLAYVNMGSGLGVAYADSGYELDIAALGAALQREEEAFHRACPGTKIIIEVGRYAVSQAGYYVAKVLDRKISYGKTYLVLKNTLNGFIRPSLATLVTSYAPDHPAPSEPLFTSGHAFLFLALDENRPAECVTLVGNLCTSADTVAKDILLPRLEVGDCVVMTNAGGYAAALSPMQFSSQEAPAQLFLTQQGAVL